VNGPSLSLLRLASLAACALLVAACGGASPTVTPTPPPSKAATGSAPAACTLLSDEDLLGLTGSTVTKMEDNVADTVYANHCRWTLKRSNGGSGTVDLGILSPGGRDRYDHSGGGDGLKPIEGLPADDAGTDDITGTIFAVRGDTLVDVFTLSLGLTPAQEIEIAKLVLLHLPG
jgi:hypothetical protein